MKSKIALLSGFTGQDEPFNLTDNLRHLIKILPKYSKIVVCGK